MVEPTTGVTVDTRTAPHVYYARSAQDSFKVDALASDTRFDQATINKYASDAKDAHEKIRMTFLGLPIILVIVGLILLALAVLFLVRRQRTNQLATTNEGSTQQEPPLVDTRG